MSRADDMTIRPRLGRRHGQKVPSRAREMRRVRGAVRRRGVLPTLVRARVARRAITTASKSSIVGRASSGLTRLIGGATVGIVVAGAVALRLISGRSFENLGAELNEILLGDLDDKARVARSVRQKLATPDVLRAIGQRGAVGAQLRSVGRDLKALELQKQRGLAAFERDKFFQVNGVLDILIIRLRNKIRAMWTGVGGPAAVEELRVNYQALVGGKSSAGGRR